MKASAPYKAGFTLVELLVVISIIGILSTMGLVIFTSAQKTARMGKRIEDLKSIKTALEMYYSVNKKYPVVLSEGYRHWRSECSGWGSYAPQDVITGLVPAYLSIFPSDPLMDKTNNKYCYIYMVSDDGADYKLLNIYISEFTQDDYKSQKDLIDPNRDGGKTSGGPECIIEPDIGGISSWAIYSYGARCW